MPKVWKRLGIGLTGLLLVLVANAMPATPAQGQGLLQRLPSAAPNVPADVEFVPGRALIKVATGPAISATIRDSQLAAVGIRAIGDLDLPGWKVVAFDPAIAVDAEVARLRSLNFVQAADPDRVHAIGWVPDDPCYHGVFNGVCRPGILSAREGPQWNFERVQAEQAWEISTGRDVVVAVLDTGYTAGPDGGRHVLEGSTFIEATTTRADDHGHGTHVSNTIVQRTNNGIGLAGLAFDAILLPVKICGSQGGCPASAIINGLGFARANGARVINLSIAAASPTQAIAEAVAAAIADDIVVVAAAGNWGWSTVHYPAAYPNVVAVGASGYSNARVSYSNWGQGLWLLAPGGDPRWDLNGDGMFDWIFQETTPERCNDQRGVLCGMQGTSMASPHVAAVAALVRSRDPHLTARQVRQVLVASALDLGLPGFDRDTGYGLVQAFSALQLAAVGPSCAQIAGAATAGDGGVKVIGQHLVRFPVTFRSCAGGW